MNIAAKPKHKSPWPRGHGIYSFGRSFLGYHYYVRRLPDVCLGHGELIFKQMYKFKTFFTHTISSLGGHYILFITMHMLYIQFRKDWPSSLLEEDINSRQNTDCILLNVSLEYIHIQLLHQLLHHCCLCKGW